jgi:hypothetical protein
VLPSAGRPVQIKLLYMDFPVGEPVCATARFAALCGL